MYGFDCVPDSKKIWGVFHFLFLNNILKQIVISNPYTASKWYLTIVYTDESFKFKTIITRLLWKWTKKKDGSEITIFIY